MTRKFLVASSLVLAACASRPATSIPDLTPFGSFGERARVLDIYPGVTATMVEPARLAAQKPIDLILYALPNGNTTAQTMGRKLTEGLDWHYDIQHIAAQTRALRTRGLSQAVVVYLEADSKSWPEWRRVHGYERANARIVEIVNQLRSTIGNPANLKVTLTGHSGGGSLLFGFIEGQEGIPSWLDRIAFLDANYNFEAAQHGAKLLNWLSQDAQHRLVVLAYDDREITLNGKKVVSDSGGTWRASQRMIRYFNEPRPLTRDTLGEFIRYRAPQIEILLHPNPQNRILHTELVGEYNGYLHALLSGRSDYGTPLLSRSRAYTPFIGDAVTLPPPSPPQIPARPSSALTGSAFIATIAHQARDEREAAIRAQLLSGNIPAFLRGLRTVHVSAIGPDSVRHSVDYEVMPDYLAIGSDDDFVRMPMTPYTAQAFGDAFGFVLPTRKMVNDIWAAANLHVDPRPLTKDRDSTLTYQQSNSIIEEQLAGTKRGEFVAGSKKDVVVTNKLQEKPQRVAIYGWHYTDGEPIQPLYTGHVDWYVDYSHGIRPVRRRMTVDGVPRSYEEVLQDPKLSYLLSDEGPIAVPRYEK